MKTIKARQRKQELSPKGNKNVRKGRSHGHVFNIQTSSNEGKAK
jgi:hypothetical protein